MSTVPHEKHPLWDSDWRPVPSRPGFAVTATGEVWRVTPSERGPGAGQCPRKIAAFNRGASPRVALRASGGHVKDSVARMLAEAFLGTAEWRFLDNDPSNVRLDNMVAVDSAAELREGVDGE